MLFHGSYVKVFIAFTYWTSRDSSSVEGPREHTYVYSRDYAVVWACSHGRRPTITPGTIFCQFPSAFHIVIFVQTYHFSCQSNWIRITTCLTVGEIFYFHKQWQCKILSHRFGLYQYDGFIAFRTINLSIFQNYDCIILMNVSFSFIVKAFIIATIDLMWTRIYRCDIRFIICCFCASYSLS